MQQQQMKKWIILEAINIVRNPPAEMVQKDMLQLLIIQTETGNLHNSRVNSLSLLGEVVSTHKAKFTAMSLYNLAS
jgi:hypothetical protein